LLFQVLRDDYVSLIVRSCWLVSFFFTPIYMFILVFLVMFDYKKGSIVSYRSNWNFHLNYNASSLYLYIKSSTLNSFKNVLNYSLIFRFIFTSVTSRSTSYFLFSFWLFFFFFGETLLLVIFNYTTPLDTISSSSFFTIKQHVIFLINSSSHTLTNHINFYILLMSSLSFTYLFNLCYTYNYNYFKYHNINLFTSFIFVIFFFMY
jgi:hypothetical protein